MLIAIVVGALIGAVVGGERGAIAGAFFGGLIVRAMRQQREIAALRESIDARFAEATRAAAAASALMPGAVAASPAAAAPAVAAEVPVAPFVAPAAAADELPISAAATSAELEREPQPFASDTMPLAEPVATLAGGGVAYPPPRDAWEPIRRWFFGGNTIVKAGIGILFIGLAFLAKYATEHAHLPPEFRLAAIGLAAVVLLGIGWRLRLRRPDYAQVLQGGAVAVLYLTLFAAFRYYGVLAAGPAFALMVAVAALAAALAVLQDARSLAVIGALGGFATPLIVSTGSNNYTALFTYYFVLDCGIAAVAWFKTWRPLNLVGFVATFVVATAWGVLKYEPSAFATSEAFLAAFFLLFVVIMILPARRAASVDHASPAQRSDAWVNSTLLFGLPTVVFALQYGLVRDTPFGTALSALGLAAFYVVLASWMRKRPELGITFDASLAIATVFLTLVIPFALDERSTAGAWTLEGAGLVWVGLRQRRMLPRAFGYLLLLIAGFAMLLGHERHGVPTLVFNAYLFNGLMAAAASIVAAYFVSRARTGDVLRSGEEVIEPLLVALATIWLASTASIQISAFVADPYTLAAGLVTASAVAGLYAVLAARLDWSGITWPAIAHAPVLFIAAAFDASMLANPAHAGGWWAWPVAFAAHGVVLRLAAPRWGAPFDHAAHAIGAITLALLGALLGRALTAGWGDYASAWPWLGWLIAPAALLLILPRPGTARVWPVRALPAAYRETTSAVLAVALLLWTLVANVASDGSADPLPHVPLINPLDIGIGVALAVAFLWLRSTDHVKPWSKALGAGAVFVWLNAMLVRAFHHYDDVPYRFDAWVDSLAVQTGLTLLWTAIALVSMWIAARRAARGPWIVGAALLGVVVIKLLLVDLSGSGSVTRIVSFIGVGVLMLIIGYVAPLPAKEAAHAAA